MEKLPKTHGEFVHLIYNCIDLSEHPKGTTLKSIIEKEADFRMGVTVKAIEHWLRGLPSTCSIPYWNDEIEEILKSCGNVNWSVDDYWKFAANRVYSWAFKETGKIHEHKFN